MRKCAFFLMLALPFAAQADVYGQAMPEGPATGIRDAVEDVAQFAGAPQKFAGRITQVCQSKGCWLVLEQDGKFARVMAKDHGFAVPKDAAGQAVAYGVLEVEPITPEHAEHLAKADGAKNVGAQEIRIIATAVEISAKP